jgi:hypothetical protein
MGLAFQLHVAPSRNVARLRSAAALTGAAGLGAAGFQLLSGPTAALAEPAPLRAAAAATLVVAAVASLWAAARELQPVRQRAARTGDVDLLAVDDEGRCRLRLQGACDPVPAELLRARFLPGLILVALAPVSVQASGPARRRPRILVLGRDSMPDRTWRQLSVWLRWMSRGRHDLPLEWKRR